MKNLYIDFDGVIMDTIKVTYDMIDRLEINREDHEKMQEFYENLNWKKILTLTPIINNAFDDIKKLQLSNKFNITILTHVNSLDEAVAKINFIRKYTKEVTMYNEEFLKELESADMLLKQVTDEKSIMAIIRQVLEKYEATKWVQ